MVESYLILTKRLGLRRWTKADFAPFCAMNQNPAVMAFYPKPLSSEETALLLVRIETHFREYGYGLYAVDVLETGTFIGYTGFMHSDLRLLVYALRRDRLAIRQFQVSNLLIGVCLNCLFYDLYSWVEVMANWLG